MDLSAFWEELGRVQHRTPPIKSPRSALQGEYGLAMRPGPHSTVVGSKRIERHWFLVYSVVAAILS